ncbi:MAG: ROK family transcriptional regulator, partial [Clostridia bacterium]|nr:ROK family transcriptional regulator [Clostridia bacterium]
MNKQVGNMQFMQKINRLKVLNFVRKNPNCSRPIIAKETGLSLPSITNMVNHLSELGYLKECGTEDVERVGRKSTLLRFSPENGKFLCVFLFDETVNIFICDLSGKASSEYEFSKRGLSLSETISLVCDKVQEITKKYGEKAFLAIGIATSGLVLGNGQFIMSSMFKWKSYNIRESLQNITDVPVFVENISPIRALYHFRSDEKYNENTIFIDLENGIGAYQFYNGQLNHSALGELGHTTVEPCGEECFCGNKGCLEAMCSPRRLLSLYEKETGEKISLSRLEELYASGDQVATKTIKNC